MRASSRLDWFSRWRWCRGSAVAVVLGILVAPVQAQAPASTSNGGQMGTPTLAIDRHVIADGGGASSGGLFAVRGTIGQADADPLQPSSGGVFAIMGGFWPGAPLAIAQESVFANGFE